MFAFVFWQGGSTDIVLNCKFLSLYLAFIPEAAYLWRPKLKDMKIVFAFVVVLSFAMASCTSRSNQPAQSDPAAGIDTTAQSAAAADSAAAAQDTMPQLEFEAINWTLIGFIQNGQRTRPIPNSNITLNMANGRINGNSGCNGYFGSYTASEDGKIEVSDLAATKRLCNGLMGQEDMYLRILQSATSWKREKVELRLSSAEGTLQFANNVPPANDKR